MKVSERSTGFPFGPPLERRIMQSLDTLERESFEVVSHTHAMIKFSRKEE